MQFFTTIRWQIWPIFHHSPPPHPPLDMAALNGWSLAEVATGTLESVEIHGYLIALEAVAWIFEITGPLTQEDKKQPRAAQSKKGGKNF